MSIRVKQATMVRPAEDTPRHTLWLSCLDIVTRAPHLNTNVVLVYPYNNNSNSSNTFFDAEVLKEALGRALVPFYPMAGRLRKRGGRLEIECTGEGAWFVEAEAPGLALADLGDFRPSPELKRLAVPAWDVSGGLEAIPLVMLQLTRFACGGVIVGFAQNHQVADGAGHVMFNNTWARLARGLEPAVVPVHERRPHLAPRDPPQVKIPRLERDLPKCPSGDPKASPEVDVSSVAVSLFKLSKDQVARLREKAASQEGASYKPSRTYEVLAAHIWRCACKARALDGDRETRLYIPTDARPRLKAPPLPPGFCGNALYVQACAARAGEITSKPLWFAASRVQETLKEGDDEEYLRSTVDYLETRPSLAEYVRGPHNRCPNITVNFWGRGLPLSGMDFGWGRPIHGGYGAVNFEGQSYIVPNVNDDGGFSVTVSLLPSHMPLFEKCFYDF